jgi:hypothetical protein
MALRIVYRFNTDDISYAAYVNSQFSIQHHTVDAAGENHAP